MRLLIILSLLFSIPSNAQKTNPIKDNGVYLSAIDYMHQTLTQPFEKGKATKFKSSNSSKIVITNKDSSYSFSYNEIWGYRKDGRDWRLYNGNFYRIDHVGKMNIYSIGCASCTIETAAYFSSSINEPLYEVNRKNLMNVFHSNTSFVNKIKSLRTLRSIYKKDKLKNTFLFVDWL